MTTPVLLVEQIKLAARDRWPEIINALGHIDLKYLTGQHGPCPFCGGRDRWRFFRDGSGGGICGQCFNRANGDGFALLRKATGKPFKEVVGMAASYLGLNNSHASGNGKATTTTNATGTPTPTATPAQPGVAATTTAVTASALLANVRIPDCVQEPDDIAKWCQPRPPIRPEAVAKYAGRVFGWPARANSPLRVLAFRARARGSNEPKALLLYPLDSKTFPAVGSLVERRHHLVRGSVEAWFWPGTPDDLERAEILVSLEGLTDVLAFASMPDVPPGMMAITNACGANSTKLDYSIGQGKIVHVIGDADEPGQAGALARAAGFYRTGAKEVWLVKLPYPVTKTHGKDVRDFLCDGGGVQ